MQLVEQADIDRTAELVDALNRHLAEMVKKYPDVEVRADHGFAIHESAYVAVEFTHGRVRVGGKRRWEDD